jgi:hypothetical protein
MSSEIQIFGREADLIVFHPNALSVKENALSLGALVGTVFDVDSNGMAVNAMRSIKEILSATEKTRKAVKEPVLELARKIDNAAKQYVAELETEYTRLQTASADYQTEQLERVRLQEEARRREAERIERERIAEQMRIEEEARKAAEAVRIRAEEEARAAKAEAARIAKEAAEKAAAELRAAKSEQDRLDAIKRAEAQKIEAARKAEADRLAAEQRAKLEAQRIAEQAERDAKAAAERRQQELEAMPAIAPATAPGQSSKRVWKWEVLNPFDLFRVNPGLVDPRPRTAEINATIDLLAKNGQTPKIVGLRIWEETKVEVRASRGGKVVDV